MALPSPREAPITSARRPLKPRSTSLSQVSISSREPVLPRRTEHIDIESVLEGERTVRHVGWNHDHLSCPYGQLALIVLSEPELQGPLQDVGELFVVVSMTRDVIPLL